MKKFVENEFTTYQILKEKEKCGNLSVHVIGNHLKLNFTNFLIMDFNVFFVLLTM